MKKILCAMTIALLLISACGCSEKQNRVLVINFTAKETDEAVDTTMIGNALTNGGMLHINNSTDEIDRLFGDAYKSFGAANESGQYYTLGALLNYISSLGWHLDQAPSSSLETIYYFSK